MITRTYTVHEVRMIKIYCPNWIWQAQGFCPEEIKGHVFLDEPWEIGKNYNKIFEEAKMIASKNCDPEYLKPVKMEIYWEIFKEES